MTKQPIFHKQHYVVIAAAIANAKTHHARHLAEIAGLVTFQDQLVQMFKLDNPGFNPAKFRTASRGE